MALVSDKYHNQKLNDYRINIKTKYIVGNKILERNTDNTINDDIENGIRCSKEYYINNNLVHKENVFDTRIEYTFVSSNLNTEEYTCPNCGMHGKLNEFINGCPYCRSYYNIDYKDKDLGSKYHYDRVLKSNKYRIITGIVDIIISLILSFIFIKSTSRTFNTVDISKVFIYGIILSIVLYYFFYIIDAYIILTPIKQYKDKKNNKQIEFWNRVNIDKKKFFNNLNYEIRKYYYSNSNIIDFDVIDYDEFNDYNKDNKLYISVKAEVRIVYYENNKIYSRTINDTYIMKKNDNVLDLVDGVNRIKCNNCGASIDATKGYCSFCKTEIPYLQEWILDNNK